MRLPQVVPTTEIRTFHGRKGRLSFEGQRALDRLLPRYSLACEGDLLDPETLFSPSLPVVVELGFGRGEATATLAHEQPGVGVIAVDVHDAGVAALLRRLEHLGLHNVRVAHGDGIVLLNRIPSRSLAGIRVFFPDPWPKLRHHKRRLVRPGLVSLLADRLQPGGLLHVATDWRPYADEMLAVLDAEPLLRNVSAHGFVPRPAWRPLTAYEQRGLRLGHQVRDLMFQRV